MQISKRLDRFEDEVFAALNEKRRALEAQGRDVIDLSVGTPNIPPEERIRQVLSQAALDPKSYVYAIRDTSALQKAAAAWYRRRYGVELDPQTQVCSLMGSQEGLSHIALTVAAPNRQPRVQAAAITNMPSQ